MILKELRIKIDEINNKTYSSNKLIDLLIKRDLIGNLLDSNDWNL